MPATADMIMLPTRPEPIPVSVSQTAVIVIDVQNAYASLAGYLDLAGFDIFGAPAVIDNTRAVLDVARSADASRCRRDIPLAV